jgi:large subunit ribosomal protein L25
METRELTIRKREGIGKAEARRLRRTGQVPGVLYGGRDPVTIAVAPHDVSRLIHGHRGSTQLLRLTFEGTSESRMAIIRDMQFDPVTDHLVHVDLQEVRMDRPIQVAVAVRHVGEAVGVKEIGGILEMILREVQVSCLPGNIPEAVEADVSHLGINDVLTVKELRVPQGVRVLNDPNQAVAVVAPPAAEEEVAAPVAAAAAVAPAEPEVLTERKPKEEVEEKGEKKEKEEKKK